MLSPLSLLTYGAALAGVVLLVGAAAVAVRVLFLYLVAPLPAPGAEPVGPAPNTPKARA